MNIKLNSLVRLWNGKQGMVVAMTESQANVVFEDGTRSHVPMTDIVAATETYSEKDAKFLQAKDRLEAFKAQSTTSVQAAKSEIPELKKPVINDSVKEWAEAMVEADLAYHLEDDPAEIINLKTGKQIFTPEQAEILRKTVDQIIEAGLLDTAFEVFIAANHAAVNKQGTKKYAPGKVDEGLWNKAIDAIKESTGKNKSDFGDSEWAQVNSVYQNMGGKFKSKKDSSVKTAAYTQEDLEWLATKHNWGSIREDGGVIQWHSKVDASPDEIGWRPVTDAQLSEIDSEYFELKKDSSKKTGTTYVQTSVQGDVAVDIEGHTYNLSYTAILKFADDDSARNLNDEMTIDDWDDMPEQIQEDKYDLIFDTVIEDAHNKYLEQGGVSGKNSSKKTAAKEYVIWGIPQGQTEETLLLEAPGGKRITSREEAERLKTLLETKYGATKTRIQELDLSQPLEWDAKKMVNPTSKKRASVYDKEMAEYGFYPDTLTGVGWVKVLPNGLRVQVSDRDFITPADQVYWETKDTATNEIVSRGRAYNMKDLMYKLNLNIAEPASDIERLSAKMQAISELSVPEKHQKQVALKTLRMPDAMVGVMGGQTKDEARAFLKSIGYSDEQLKKLEASKKQAGHPNDFGTKYHVGDILVPVDTKQCPERGYTHVQDVDLEKKVYVLRQRPLTTDEKPENETLQDVRIERPIKDLDSDKGLTLYASKLAAKIKQAGGGAGITFKNFEFDTVFKIDRQFHVTQIPNIVRFDAEGYDDGMDNVNGNLVKVSSAEVLEYEKDEAQIKSEEQDAEAEAFTAELVLESGASDRWFGGQWVRAEVTLDSTIDLTYSIMQMEWFDKQGNYLFTTTPQSATLAISLKPASGEFLDWYGQVFADAYYPEDEEVKEWIDLERESADEPDLYSVDGEYDVDSARTFMIEDRVELTRENYGGPQKKRRGTKQAVTTADIQRQLDAANADGDIIKLKLVNSDAIYMGVPEKDPDAPGMYVLYKDNESKVNGEAPSSPLFALDSVAKIYDKLSDPFSGASETEASLVDRLSSKLGGLIKSSESEKEVDGYYVMGEHSSVGWYKTKEEAEKACTQLNYRGGANYRVEPSYKTVNKFAGTLELGKSFDLVDQTYESLLDYNNIKHTKFIDISEQVPTAGFGGAGMGSYTSPHKNKEIYVLTRNSSTGDGWVENVYLFHEPFTVEDAVEFLKRVDKEEDERSGAVDEHVATKTKFAATNQQVIDMFVADTFPKDKMPEWETPNLKISKKPNGWALMNYATAILYRGANGELFFNTQRYSPTTSAIQNKIRQTLEGVGKDFHESDEATINQAIEAVSAAKAPAFKVGDIVVPSQKLKDMSKRGETSNDDRASIIMQEFVSYGDKAKVVRVTPDAVFIKYVESDGSEIGMPGSWLELADAATASISRLSKKAARLGNWEFDVHEGSTWALEASEDGKQRIVRCK